MNLADPPVDLSDVDLFAAGNHHRSLARLRESAPVHWNPTPDGGFWALTRYDDVVNAYRDHATFSSTAGAVLGTSFRSERDTAAGRMLVATDPPRHRLLRAGMHPAFSPSVADRVRKQVGALVDDALDRLVAAGGGDIATDLAPQLPAGALMAMVGVEHTEALELIAMTRRMIGFREPVDGDPVDDERLRLVFAQGEIFAFFAELVGSRRDDGGDDLVRTLLRAEMNGRTMTDEEILYNCLNVAVGGNETSSHTACAGIDALMRHPDQHERLVAAPDLLDRAVAEILRWSSTNAYVRRVAQRDVEIRGTLIGRGQSLTLWNVAANRDPEHFPDPDRFDVGRTPNRHLSFGSGIHRCIGASIGLTQLSDVFARLAERRIRLKPAGPAVRLRSNFILGFTNLPVEVVHAG